MNFAFNSDFGEQRLTSPPHNHSRHKDTTTSHSSFAHETSESALPWLPSFDAVALTFDSFFEITERRSSIGQEIRAGAVTFFTMAYILVVNADILNRAFNKARGELPMDFDSVVVATALSAAVGCTLVGVFANLGFGLAPGMGLNSYFTYGVVLHNGLSWRVALTCCFVQGILFAVLSLCGACNVIQLYAPPCIKKSITVGLGLFQALIGYECIKLVIPGEEVLLGLGDITSPRILLSLAGLLLICLLLVCDVKAAMLIGIVCITVISWITGLHPSPNGVLATPTLTNTVFALDFTTYFAMYTTTVPITLMFLFVSIFDTAGVQMICGSQADLLDEDDNLPGSTAAFFSAATATTVGSCLGTSSVIIHNETLAGIHDGARTGLSALTIAVLFLLSLPFLPLIRAVPPEATAPPLIVVGMCMMADAKSIEWKRIDEALPAFLTLTLLPLTYSIANGMVAGLIAFVSLKFAAYCVGRIGGDVDDIPEELSSASGKSPYMNGHGRRDSLSTDPPYFGAPSGLTSMSDPVRSAASPDSRARLTLGTGFHNSFRQSATSHPQYGSYESAL